MYGFPVKKIVTLALLVSALLFAPNHAVAAEPSLPSVPTFGPLSASPQVTFPALPPAPAKPAFEPEFGAELLRYQHERDGVSSFKSMLALTEASLAISVLASGQNKFALGIATVTSLRAIDFAYEVGTVIARNLLLDKELKTRAEIRTIRNGWLRFALFSAAMNAAVGLLSCIGWLAVKNDYVRGLFTGLTVQTAHSVAEELVDALIMRPW
jgi:hypothetical protein